VKKFQVDQPVCHSNRVTFFLSEDTVKLYLSVIHQMHLMAKFGYASLNLLTEIPVYKISSTTRKTVIKENLLAGPSLQAKVEGVC
jgi:hypothetical protein